MSRSGSLRAGPLAETNAGASDRAAAPRTGDALEAAAVFLLILFHIWVVSRYVHMAWLVILPPVIYSHWRHRESPARLGFRRKNFVRCVRDFAPLILGLAGVPLVLGALLGTLRAPGSTSPLAMVASYCVWGTFQQYALNGFFVNRVSAATSASEQGWVPIVAATLFAIVHAPNWFLVVVTFTLGVLCARIYLMYRNLFFLGIAHGVIASVLYMTVPTWITMRYHIGPAALQYMTQVSAARP